MNKSNFPVPHNNAKYIVTHFSQYVNQLLYNIHTVRLEPELICLTKHPVEPQYKQYRSVIICCQS